MVRVENIRLLDNWKRYTLQEMLDAEIILSHLDGNHGELYPNKEEFVESGVPYLSANCIVDDEVDFEKTKFLTQERASTFKKGVAISDDVLFAHNATVGPVAILKTNLDFVVLSTTLTYYRCNKKYLLPNYLKLYMISDYFVNQYTEVMRQATRNQVPITKQRTFFHLVPPLPEQQRIVSILDEAFAAIAKAKANAEQNLNNAKELFESYLQSVFENKGEGWEEKTLGDIGKPSMCKRILKNQTSSTGDIPFYKIGTFGKKPDAFISKEIYNEFRTKYSFPKKGDILISASGTIGRRVRYDGEPAFFQDSNIVWIDNDEKQVLNDYLYVFYEFCDWQPSKGATISRLYNSNLTSIKIAFPKSLEEQKNILKKINALSTETKKLETIYQQKINDLEELKKSVLQMAFNGELKIAQPA